MLPYYTYKILYNGLLNISITMDTITYLDFYFIKSVYIDYHGTDLFKNYAISFSILHKFHVIAIHAMPCINKAITLLVCTHHS